MTPNHQLPALTTQKEDPFHKETVKTKTKKTAQNKLKAIKNHNSNKTHNHEKN